MKTKFKSLPLSKLHVADTYAFLLIVHGYLKPLAAGNAKLKRLIDELEVLLEAIKKATSANSFKGESEAVNQADKRRDNRIVAFRLLIELGTYSEDATTAELANLILSALDAAGGRIAALSLKEETTAIHSLNEKFTTTQRYIDALAALKGTDSWAGVWAAQQDFESTYGYRNGVMVEEKVEGTAYEYAKQARAVGAALFELVEDLYHIEEKPEYLNAINLINPEIEKMVAAISTRETLAKAKAQPAS